MVSASNFVSVDKNNILSAVNAFLPKQVFIPLCEDDTCPFEILVSEGTYVKEGDVIAKSKNLFVHSSVPGLVQKIVRKSYTNGKEGFCAQIALEGSFSFLGKSIPAQNWRNYEKSTIEYLLRESGVINTFSQNVPVFSELKKKGITTGKVLILRLFDIDPSFITESFLSNNYLKIVLEGAAIISKALSAKACIVACSNDSNLPDEINSFKDFFSPETELFSISLDTHKYPAGTMHDIVSAIKKTYKIDLFSKIGNKDLFIDSVTAYNAYNAVVFGKPVISNFIHVTGDCLNASAVLNIRIGTKLGDIVAQCGGFKRKLFKIVVNGIVLGKSVGSLDVPIGRNVKSIEFIPEHQVKLQKSEPCVRCGNCRKICPMNLWPGNLYRIFHLETLANAGESDVNAYKSALICSECGLCNSVCPSRLPLVQTITLLKETNYEK